MQNFRHRAIAANDNFRVGSDKVVVLISQIFDARRRLGGQRKLYHVRGGPVSKWSKEGFPWGHLAADGRLEKVKHLGRKALQSI